MSAALGALLVVAVAVLRIYLGWAYVGGRLLSAAVEYEETGWYDGQLFVKPPEVLARDRLLGSYEVPIALHSACICPFALLGHCHRGYCPTLLQRAGQGRGNGDLLIISCYLQGMSRQRHGWVH